MGMDIHRGSKSWLPILLCLCLLFLVAATKGAPAWDEKEPTVQTTAAGQQPIDHQTRKIRVALVGDSITYGYGVSNREINSYPALLQQMIATFRRANPGVIVYLCLPPPCFPGRWGINDKTIHREIVPLVRQIARESGARVIDLNGALAGQAGLFPDTVHPNNDGAKIIAATIYHSLTGNRLQDL
jgi:lysophospholipase L1-like esterase